jgi:hypothetical protein
MVEPVKSSLGSQIATAVVFSAIVGGIVFAARHAAQSPQEDSEAEVASEDPPGAPPTPLTVESARSAKELYAALLAKFGTNGRGHGFVSLVDYDKYSDRLQVSFPLDEPYVAAPTARASGLKRVRDLLETVRGTRMHWNWILVTATAPARDKDGTMTETTVIRTQVLRGQLAALDWGKFTGDDVKSIAEQFWVHPDLSQPIPAEAAATQPAPQ